MLNRPMSDFARQTQALRISVGQQAESLDGLGGATHIYRVEPAVGEFGSAIL